MTKVRDILGPDMDSEFLQSFVRVGLRAEEEEDAPYKSVYQKQKPDLSKQMSEGKSEGGSENKTPRRTRFLFCIYLRDYKFINLLLLGYLCLFLDLIQHQI